MVKIDKQNRNGKEASITYANDSSININIFNNEILKEIVGAFDNNLRELEKLSGSEIYYRGNSIIIKLSLLVILLKPLANSFRLSICAKTLVIVIIFGFAYLRRYFLDVL